MGEINRCTCDYGEHPHLEGYDENDGWWIEISCAYCGKSAHGDAATPTAALDAAIAAWNQATAEAQTRGGECQVPQS